MTEDVSVATGILSLSRRRKRRRRAKRREAGDSAMALATTAFLAYNSVLHHFTSLRRPSAGRSATRGNLGYHVGGHYSSCTPARTHTSYEPPCTACCLPSAERLRHPRCNTTPESWRVLTTLPRGRLRAASFVVVHRRRRRRRRGREVARVRGRDA